MKFRHIIAIAFFAGALSLPTFAQTSTPQIDKREQAQKERIRQGVRSGELTRKEARRLATGQAKIRAEEKRAKADGIVTPQERAKITRDQNKASKRIAKQKHDAQKR